MKVYYINTENNLSKRDFSKIENNSFLYIFLSENSKDKLFSYIPLEIFARCSIRFIPVYSNLRNSMDIILLQYLEMDIMKYYQKGKDEWVIISDDSNYDSSINELSEKYNISIIRDSLEYIQTPDVSSTLKSKEEKKKTNYE